MSPQSKPVTHLPLLYNPLLNCIFNNPQYSKSPFRNVIQELSSNHNDFMILVPLSHILHECYDPATVNSNNRTLLKDSCYSNEDFIQSHIVRTSNSYSSTVSSLAKVQSIIYNTMNGKQILIKNGMVFTGKGFKKSLKLKIIGINYFNSFCDYFPKDSKFMIIYIEDTLIGSFDPKRIPPIAIQEASVKIKAKNENKNFDINESITFELLLRSFPLLSKAVSNKFYKLLHHNNSQFTSLRLNNRKKLTTIISEFHTIVEEAFKIISESIKEESPDSTQTYNAIHNILNVHPGLDLDKLVHEYVELNLYDKIWSQLMYQFNFPNDEKDIYDPDSIKVLTKETYSSLSYLSLNQLDVIINEPWKANEMYRRVFLAIQEFSKLKDPTIMDSSGKTRILLNTVNILTDNKNYANEQSSFQKELEDDLIIDADTLLGLLIMILVHSKIDNLEAHLLYIKCFNSVDISNNGYLNYILSNIDAVILHLSSNESSSQHFDLKKSSDLNEYFWLTIESEDIDQLTSILNEVDQQFEDSLPSNHFLKSRNIYGESCLMMAIQTKNVAVFDLLTNFNPNWFSIDEILFDKNITTLQNLLMSSLIGECHEITLRLIELLRHSATEQEQIYYINSTDLSKRSVGHYLFHDYKIIDEIGHLVDWELKDLNGHTPLFSLCRCYDHANYSDLIFKAFKSVYRKHKGMVNFDKHIDKLGNTLLHVVLKDLDKTELLSNSNNLVDINQWNSKSMTPMELYVKYNRLENLENILQDNRLLFKLEDYKNFYNVFDYSGFVSAKTLSHNKTSQDIERLLFRHFVDNYYPKTTSQKVVALNGKYDPSLKDWVIYFQDSNNVNVTKSLESLKQIIGSSKLENELSLLPDEETFWQNFPLKSTTVPLFNKFKINRLIESFNVFFIALNFQSKGNCESIFSKIMDRDFKIKSTFEVIKEVSYRQEVARSHLAKIKLSVTQIREIEYFLKFSIEDLKGFQKIIAKMNKLLSIGDVKQSDFRIVFDKAISLILNSGIANSSLKVESMDCFRNEDSAFKEMLSLTMWLEKCLNLLFRNIKKVLDRINIWDELHDHITELSSELRNYEAKYPTKTEGPATALDKNDESSFSYFAFGSIIESKKSKYKKMLLLKSEKTDQIIKLNSSIKLEHELIASELSNFLTFKADFMRFAIKNYTFTNIKLLRFRKYELMKFLSRLD